MLCPICQKESKQASVICQEHFPITLDADGRIISYTKLVQGYWSGNTYISCHSEIVYLKKS
jgi:hypothetical protein